MRFFVLFLLLAFPAMAADKPKPEAKPDATNLKPESLAAKAEIG